jgi:hypothetical protein
VQPDAAFGGGGGKAPGREPRGEFEHQVHAGRVTEQPERARLRRGVGGARVAGGAGVRTRAGQRVDERGAPARVLQAHLADVAFQVTRGQQREEGVLHRLGDPLAERGPQLRQPLDQPGVRDQPARAESRGQHLRGGPEVDDHFGVHAV